jgi:hypothetical protein
MLHAASTEGANSHTRSGYHHCIFLKAVWRDTVDRHGAPKEQTSSLLAGRESLRYQGQGERHGLKSACLLLK